MTINHTPIDMDDLIGRYLAGESENALSRRYGVERSVIARRLRRAGIQRRSQTEANRLLAASRTPEERQRYASAAHAAVRARKQSVEHRSKIAQTRQARQLGVSPAETLLQVWLRERGIEATPQTAIGPYNVDLGAAPVAVEVFGGGWHGYGRHRRRSPERYRYLLDSGWNLVIVWVDTRKWMLAPAAADYIAAFHQLTSSDPSVRGQYRVIWGDGKDVPASCLNLDNLTDVPSRRAADRARATD